MAKLNDIQIKNWIKNKEYFEGKADGDGLYLCFRKDFSLPRWNFRYRFAGKQRVLGIGTYGQLSLADARRTAKELRARVSLGYDVASEKQARKHKELEVINAFTFADLVDQFMDNKVKDKWTNYGAIKGRIDKDIKPHLGALLVESVKPAHIDTMLKAIMERNAPSVANDILRWTKRIFDYAIKRHIVSYNPASAFNSSDAGGKAIARSRALNKAELVALFEAMRNTQGFTETNYLTIKLLLLLAVRKGELIEARREEFDLDAGLWHLPTERTKTNAAITIPLSKPAIEALRALMAVSHSDEYLLPARKSQLHKLPTIHENTLNEDLAA